MIPGDMEGLCINQSYDLMTLLAINTQNRGPAQPLLGGLGIVIGS